MAGIKKEEISQEKYPNFQRCYKAKEVTCTIGKEEENYSISFQWYLKGKYVHSDPTKILGCFVKTLEELPNTVSLTLESKITETTESGSILLCAVDVLQQQRAYHLSKLEQLRAILGPR